MATLLLDTDAVADHLNGIRSTTKILDRALAAGDVLATNAIVFTEVISGSPPERRAAAQDFLGGLYFLEMPAQAARQAGEIRYAAARRGVTLGVPDVLIATTALYYGASVVTGNVRHYQQMAVSIIPIPCQTR